MNYLGNRYKQPSKATPYFAKLDLCYEMPQNNSGLKLKYFHSYHPTSKIKELSKIWLSARCYMQQISERVPIELTIEVKSRCISETQLPCLGKLDRGYCVW